MARLRSIHFIALALLGAPTSGRGIQGADCNENGSSDGHDIVSGLSLDCNQNLVPDECDILPRGAAFEEISSVGVGQRPRAAGAADLDGDGDVDLLTANQDSNDRTMLFREEATLFHRGDSNADGSLNLTDAIFTLAFLFLGDEPPACIEAANTNDDALLDITDAISLLSYLFLGSEPPAPPGPPPGACALDPGGAADDLGCAAYGACQTGP